MPNIKAYTWVMFFLLFSFHAKSSEKPKQKIIALAPHAVEMLYTIGAGDRIVGTVEYSNYPEAAKAIPRIGNYTGIQIERVVELQPDFIVTWPTGNQAADIKKLESLGYTTHGSLPKTINGIADDLEALGKLTKLEANANKAAHFIRTEYQKIKDRYKNKRKVNVFYQMYHDPFRTIGPGSWADRMINDCGGINIFNDAKTDYPIVSLESILVKNPEVIIIPHTIGALEEKTAIWNPWSEIDAVKHQRFQPIPSDLLHRFTTRALEGLQQMCDAIDSAR